MSTDTTNTPTLTDAQVREQWVHSMLHSVGRTREDIEATYDAWMAEHDARVRQAVIEEPPTLDQCVTVLNTVSVPLGDPPTKGYWAMGAIRRCRDVLIAVRRDQGKQGKR